MSHNVVKHTKVEISLEAQDAMGGLPRRDRRLMKHLLKRVRSQSLFKVLQTPSLPETQTAFVRGELWIHALETAIAFFRLEGAVLRLIAIIGRAELRWMTDLIRAIEQLVIWEMEEQWQKHPARQRRDRPGKFRPSVL